MTGAIAATSRFPNADVVDSHTEGEPTRVVVDGWPQPVGATMAERRDDLRERYDHLRRAVVCEPRGHDAVVGALLTPPVEPGSPAGIVFFNNVGYLGMCGHGLIGVVRTLEHLGRLDAGRGPVRHAGRDRRRGAGRRTARSRSRTCRRAATRWTSRSTFPASAGWSATSPTAATGSSSRSSSNRRSSSSNLDELLRIDARASGRAPRAGHHRRGRRGDRPHRADRPAAAAPTPTRATSCSAPAASTTARRAARGPRRRWRRCTPAAGWRSGQEWRQESITGRPLHRVADP